MKNAWIIGASSGIGSELAKQLYRDGYNLIISSRNKESLENLKREIEPKNKRNLRREIFIADFDVSNEDDFKKSFKKISSKFTKIDLAIFASAIYKPMKLSEFDLKFSKETINVNLIGFLNFLDLIIPKMINQKSGHIAAIASVAGYRGLPESLAYGASKAAMINLCEGIYSELKFNKINISVINPGFVETRLTQKNKFPMPFIISPKKAAEEIIKGLKCKKFEIHFPKKFTFILKFLRILHVNIFLKIVEKFIFKKSEKSK